MVSRIPLQEQQGRKSTTTTEGCALPEAGSSGTGFSLWVLGLASPKRHRLKPVPQGPVLLGRSAQGFRA